MNGSAQNTVVITGANRGLGLEFTRQYLDDGWNVVACCRNPDQATELQSLRNERLQLQALDVADSGQVQQLANQLQGQPVDILINNAGIYGHRHQQLENIEQDSWNQVFTINSQAPLFVTRALLPNVQASQLKTVANVSSKMGSMADNSSGSAYIYRSSKAALNAVSKSLAEDLREQGVKVVALHPGWVQTDMGGDGALISTQESIKGLRNTIDNLADEQSGGFFDYKGEPVPW